jgi:geranylgeranyl diphosphate synthase, type II
MKHQPSHTIEHLQERIKQAFDELPLRKQPEELYIPITYTLAQGGKRIRPLLTLLACDMFGGNIEDAINPAIGIELFHNFTLIHDDIMDQAPLRRGKETVYKKWNTNVAILSGDTIFAQANLFILTSPSRSKTRVARLFNRTAIQVCEGQQYDMNFETRNDVSIAEYMEMIRLKTAVLLAASLKMGVLTAFASEKSADILYDFGIKLGLAFQLKDDLLDVYGSQEKFGKVSGGDIIECKKTFLYLKALELAGDKQDDLRDLYNSRMVPASEKVADVKNIFNKLNIEEITQNEVEKYYRQAVDLLASLDIPGTYKIPLQQYTSELMYREK